MSRFNYVSVILWASIFLLYSWSQPRSAQAETQIRVTWIGDDSIDPSLQDGLSLREAIQLASSQLATSNPATRSLTTAEMNQVVGCSFNGGGCFAPAGFNAWRIIPGA